MEKTITMFSELEREIKDLFERIRNCVRNVIETFRKKWMEKKYNKKQKQKEDEMNI